MQILTKINANSIKLTQCLLLMSVFIMTNTSTAMVSDRIRVAGSTSMYPLMTAVAERYAYETDKPSPIIEATGTGGGIKVFCNGIGKRFPDIVAASRPMSVVEREFCATNGIHDILEIHLGFDGIVLAQSLKGRPFSIKQADLKTALGKGSIEQPAPQKWSDVQSNLPQAYIKIFGPPSTSGTKEALETLLAADDKTFTLRDDGHYVDASDQESVIAQKLLIEHKTIGVFSYGFYEKNLDHLRALRINGYRPTYKNIISGQYPLSRPLYIYIKICPAERYGMLKSFLMALLDPATSGTDGYLRSYGFIAHPRTKHQQIVKLASQFIERMKKLD